MEFYIKKNSTLPILKMEIIKDGRSDYNFNSFLSASTTFLISLYDKSNDKFLFASKECYITAEYSDFEGKELFYLNYQFTNKDTLKTGRYEVQVSVPSDQGVVLLPLQSRYYVNILDSFSIDNLGYTDQYSAKLPCCGFQETFDVGGLVLTAYYYEGSLVADYLLSSTNTFNQDIIVEFKNDLGTKYGSTISITTGVTIFSGQLNGITKVVLNDVNYDELSQVSYISDVKIIYSNPNIILNINANSIFNTPPPTLAPTQTPTVTQTPTNTLTPSQTITQTLTNTPTFTNTPTQTLTNTPTFTNTPTQTPTVTQTITQTSTPPQTPTQTPTVTQTITETPTQTPTQTPTVTPLYFYYNLLDCGYTNNKIGRSIVGGLTGIYNVDNSKCYFIVGILFVDYYDYDLDSSILVSNCGDILCIGVTPTATQTPTVTETPTNTPTPTESETPTPTSTPTPTETPTMTPTESETPTPTPTETPTTTPTETPTNTPTPTESETPTPTPTITPTQIPITGTTYVLNYSETNCGCDDSIGFMPSSLNLGVTLYSDINLTNPLPNNLIWVNLNPWAINPLSVGGAGCVGSCDCSYTNYEISNNSLDSVEITITLANCLTTSFILPPQTIVSLDSATEPIVVPYIP